MSVMCCNESSQLVLNLLNIIPPKNYSFFFYSQTSSSSSVKVGDLEMGEIDGLDEEIANLNVGPRVMSAKINKSQHNSKPIDVKTAVVSIVSILMLGFSVRKTYCQQYCFHINLFSILLYCTLNVLSLLQFKGHYHFL